MHKHTIFRLNFVAVWFFGMWGLVSCGDDKSPECENATQCPRGEICLGGACVVDPNDTFGSDSETVTNAPSTDSDTDSTPVSTDSDTGNQIACPKVPTFGAGESCQASCQCISGNCSNGFCCDGGACCRQSGDCPSSACGMPHCVSNSCVYTFDDFPCGAVTMTGTETCMGENVCDGQGNCIPAAMECAPYAVDIQAANCDVSPAQVSCYSSCTAANAAQTCQAGNICENGKCVSPTGKTDGSVCTSSNECLSGYCRNGYCCASGDCCATATDCSDLCIGKSECTAQFQCSVTAFTGCGDADATGNDTCTGDKRCDGLGQCVATSPCRTGNGIESYSCVNGTVTQNCGCTGNDDCDADTEFCNDGFLCIDGICNFAAEENPCPQSPCHPDVTCDESARACTEGTNPCDSEATLCDPKSCVALDANSYECAPNPLENGVACTDGLRCNGTAEFCLDGECVDGGISTHYCFDPNPCAPDYNCIESAFGTTPTCEPVAIRDIGSSCSPNFNCFGDSGTCQPDPQNSGELMCIQSEEMCMSNGICATYACSEDYTPGSITGFTCDIYSNSDDIATLTCDAPTVTISINDGKFTTRSYFDYNTTCNPGGDSFMGMETRVILAMDQSVTNATLTITDIDSTFTGDLEMLLFDSNPCQETNCIQRGTNNLTFSSADGFEIVVLDSTNTLWPPQTVTLQLDCNL
ncbi:MAG: hypothetical protein JXR76_10055 [Deltaproteobacteria bacterium]|nr:hypothetical protein [Deltaproteobacteria bacterium]